ncbi:MAG: hypothetical protein KTR25_14615, partial [Myxococcales bacterium]|nr:hypothetical protein [Myxococcales bacterium]
GLSFEIHTANVEYSWTDNFLFNNRDSRSAAKVVLLNNQVGETEPDVATVRDSVGEPTNP